ncbi:uncharacterized protein BDR25DRAFT_300421 [Lindgomyces ingoldianus]|uniref:Uncharacterized protein n=1 Tax=Lindgomyces ingoldianus TaxID=673940 RepID=A0ACB6RAS2_9PLEO|nr:uncharacterized protein BDR25DRAFT_300421 [Lindgomyces ingoldianus]KAF2476404.1 hypothetical protein BDR25DRAFT_300421 [Lindgomyces ingoldianus]
MRRALIPTERLPQMVAKVYVPLSLFGGEMELVERDVCLCAKAYGAFRSLGPLLLSDLYILNILVISGGVIGLENRH